MYPQDVAKNSLDLLVEIAKGLDIPVYVIATKGTYPLDVLVKFTQDSLSLLRDMEKVIQRRPSYNPDKHGEMTFASIPSPSKELFKYTVFSPDYHLSMILSTLGLYNIPIDERVELLEVSTRVLSAYEREDYEVDSNEPVYIIRIKAFAPGALIMLLHAALGSYLTMGPFPPEKDVLWATVNRPKGRTIVFTAMPLSKN